MKGMVIFRNDLRLHDNETLNNAVSECDNILLLYILENRLLGKTEHGFNKLGSSRARFLRETLIDLKENIEKKGGRIYFAIGNYDEICKEIIESSDIERVYLSTEYTSEEIDSINDIKSFIEVKQYHNHTAFRPEDIPYESPKAVPNVFSGFKRKTENRSSIQPYIATPKYLDKADFHLESESIESLFDNPEELFTNIDYEKEVFSETAFPFKGGESNAQERVQDYIFSSNLIDNYNDTRNNLLGYNYSSKFSPWLSNGSLSARYLWNIIEDYENDGKGSESSYKLRFELMWRDYFKYLSIKHGDKIFWYKGLKDTAPTMKSDREVFESWQYGKTEDPFINANMQEILKTGWMSNRGRQVVASYLTKDLGIDWRLGAEWFEEKLLDYDPTSNYCNWQYQAGVGVDYRPYRKFNPKLQAKKYDPEGEFQKLWLGDSFNKDSLF